MSASSLGRRREFDLIDTFVAHGFWWLKASRSGQSIKPSRSCARIPCDMLFFAPEVGLIQAECGGSGKRLGVTFAELRERLLPGAAPMVVTFVKRRRWYYTDEDSRHDNLGNALDALRA